MPEQKPSLQELIRRRQGGGFVGRQEQLGQFEENLGLPLDDIRRRFLCCLHGPAGVGKTYLVKQLVRTARQRKVLTAYVDHVAYDVITALETFVADLATQGARCRELPDLVEQYRQRRHELEADPSTPDEVSSMLARTTARLGLKLAGEVPFAGMVADEVDPDALARRLDRARSFLGRKFRSSADVRLVLSPVEVLTAAFTRDLAAIGASAPVALFFDTYEQTGAFLDSWLLKLLGGRYGELPGNLLVTVAGQAPLDDSRWSDYLPVRADFALEVFTDAEARQLLMAQGVTDPRVVEVILELSGRLPVWVATLASKQPGTVHDIRDPTDGAVGRFLGKESDPRRKSAAQRGALPRAFSRDLYVVINGDESGFDWLRGLPFVTEHRDGYRYHDVVRAAMLRVVRRDSESTWTKRHATLAAHFRAMKEGLDLTGRDALKDEAWQRFAAEDCYHELCGRGLAALPAALGGLVDVIAWHPSLTGSWLQMISQAGRDSANAEVTREGARLAAAHSDGDHQLELLTVLIGNARLDPAHRAAAHVERGTSYRLLARYEEALADFDRAIELDPTDAQALEGRGSTYDDMGRYEEALADFDRAVELDPRAARIVASRGLTHWMMDRYDKALADFDTAIEINPTYSWAIACRGEVYRSMERYEQALANFDRSLELDPESSWALACRAVVYRLMERYEEALADFERALDLDGDVASTVIERGYTYRLTERYAEALVDFDKALELEPESAQALGRRGETFFQMKRFESALADLDRAVELDPGIAWIVAQRGEVHQEVAKLDRALADYDRAIEMVPDSNWILAKRGEVRQFMGNPEAALKDFGKAIEVEPRGDWVFRLRGETYSSMMRYEDALAEFDEAIGIDPKYLWAIQQRAQVYRELGRYEEARADFTRLLDESELSAESVRWLNYQLALLKLAEGDADAARVRLDHLVDTAPNEPDDSFSEVIYQIAAGARDAAREQLVAALASGDCPTPRQAWEAIQDLRELNRVTGIDVAEFIALVRDGRAS